MSIALVALVGSLKQSRLGIISVSFFFVWASKYKINFASVVASLQGALEALVRMHVCGGGGEKFDPAVAL